MLFRPTPAFVSKQLVVLFKSAPAVFSEVVFKPLACGGVERLYTRQQKHSKS